MDWIFDNIWVIVAIAAVIARMFGKKEQGDEAEGQPKKEYEFEDPELAERTRKIREEIQRKIAERRGEPVPPPIPQSQPATIERSPEATTPPATLPEIFREVMQPRPAPVPPPLLRRAMTVNLAEEAERQAALMEKLKEAELMKAAAQRRLAFEASIADKETTELKQARAGVVEDLRSPAALRRAFVLREVLGPPVALR
jgi:hypothetical protein